MKLRNKIFRWLAHRAPKRFVYWCGAEVLYYATGAFDQGEYSRGQYGSTVVTDVTAMSALDRYHRDHNL